MSQQLLAKPVVEKITSELLQSDKAGVSLGLLYLGNNPVIEKFVDRKKKFAEKLEIPLELVQIQDRELENLTFEDIQKLVSELVERYSGIVIQLPLDKKFQEREQEILDLVPTTHDVDVLSTQANKLFEEGNLPFVPAVAGSIAELATFYGIIFDNKKVAIIGQGKLVGLPVSKLFDLKKVTYDIFVKGDSLETLCEYEIIVAGTGIPGLLEPKHVTRETVVFDAGTSEKGGVVVGDLDPSCFDLVAGYSPVPGGIGPLTVAVLFKNLIETRKRV